MPTRSALLTAAKTTIFLTVLSACGTGVTDPNDAFIEGVVVPGTTTSLNVESNQQTRLYLLHDTQSPTGTRTALPLVILLHGSGLTAADIRITSAMDSIADARHFLVAYPQGLGSPSDWNAGNCCGDPAADGTDDIAFIKAVITDVSTRLVVNPRRIYVAGFSDGARMAYRVACDMSTQVAAIAAVSGSLVTPGCAPQRVMPVIAFNGTADPSVGYSEPSATAPPGAPPVSSAGLPPVVRYWLASSRCRNTSNSLFARTTVRYSGTGCTADVAFYSTTGGVHEWPSHQDYGFDASVVMVDFFRTHMLPQ